jgi:hypothetical protein
MAANTTFNKQQAADLLGITHKQARRLEDIFTVLDADSIRMAQVAVALARAAGNVDTSLSSLPAIARAVLGTPPGLTPFHAIYKDSAVSYVVYRADLADHIGSGAVVAKIDRLYPEEDDHAK